MSSFNNYVDNGIHSQNSSIDATRLGRNLISRTGTNIYRSSYSSTGLSYGTRPRSNGNTYCTAKNGNFIGNRFIDAHWGRDRGTRKFQTVIFTKTGIRTGKYSDTLLSYPIAKQYRYSSSPQVIDKSSTVSSIPIKTHSSFSSTKYSTLSNAPGSSVSRVEGDRANISKKRSNDDGKSLDSCHESGKAIDVDQVSAENENIILPTSTSPLRSCCVKTKSTECLTKSFTKHDDKNNECKISLAEKLPNSTSNSSLNSELFENGSRVSSSRNESSTSSSASHSNKLIRSSSQQTLDCNVRECANTSLSNWEEGSSDSLLSKPEITCTQNESSKAQARLRNVAENMEVQSEKSSRSSLLSQRSSDGSSNDICGKANDPSRHKSAVPVSSGCNNSARSSRKLVPSSSSVSAAELTAIKIKSAATTTTIAAAASSRGSDSGSTSKSSSSSGSGSCSGNSSGSNISSDSNNSISSRSASDASKSSNGKREIIPVVSPVSFTQTVPLDVRNKKPPIPKSEMIRKKMSSPINKYVNKDFRKSALNMENGDASRSQITKKKCRQKSSKNPSIASQDSQAHISNNSTSPNNHQFIRDSSSQSFSSDGASSCNSSNENEEQNQPNCASKPSISQNVSESSALITDAKQLVSSVDERSISVNSLSRTRSSSKSISDAFKNTEDKSVPLINSPLASASFPNGKSWCTAAYLEGNNKVSLSQSSPNAPQCKNLDGSSPANKSFGQTQRQLSDEVPWWLEPHPDNVPEGVERHLSAASDDISQDTTISTILPDDGKFKFKIWRQGSEERCWWLDDNENDCTFNDNHLSLKNETASPVRESSSKSLDAQSKNSSISKPSSPEDYWYKKRALRHEQSGERAWWLSDDPNNIPEGVDVIPVSPSVSQYSQPKEKSSEEQEIKQTQNRFTRLRHIDSGERPWWLDNSSNVPEGVEKISLSDSQSDDSSESLHKVDCSAIQQQQQYQNIDEVDRGCRRLASFPLSEETIVDRTSPEGRENPPNVFSEGRSSPYDNIKSSLSLNDQSCGLFEYRKPVNASLYIGNQTNIDDLLEDLIEFDQTCREMEKQNEHFTEYISDRSETTSEVGLHDNRTSTYNNIHRHRNVETQSVQNYIPLDDSALQLYKDGDYGAYLDLEASISEQQEEFEGFQTNRKNSIVLRTQLSVRVHTIIEKLLNSEGRELRRALFSLKQIFQEDKDLVHEFVQNDGLACLIKVGSEADQNYQNYILRALGQVMLYVDGMNGVMEHGQTVQWLYSLIASRFRLVVKTALKLLLVFVEYVESNSLLLVRAIRSIDTSRGMIPWTNMMRLLKDYDAADTELLIYTMSLVNKCLNGIPDQDTYYDQVDCLEEQGIQIIIQNYMGKQGTDLDLLRQFHIYEAVLHHEDSNERDLFSVNSPIRTLDDNIRKTLRNRKSLVESQERRKSRRHSTGTSPHGTSQLPRHGMPNSRHQLDHRNLLNKGDHRARRTDDGEEEEEDEDEDEDDDDDAESSSSQSSQSLNAPLNNINGSYSDKSSMDVGVTPALRRRRERAERQRSFIREQQEASANMRASFGQPACDQNQSSRVRYTNGSSPYEVVTNGTGSNNAHESNRLTRASSRKDVKPLLNAVNKFDSEAKNQQSLQQQAWYAKSPEESAQCTQDNHADEDEDRRVVLQLKRENTVKDLTQKLAAQHLISANVSPAEEKVSRIGDMSGLISKAKEGLAKSKSKAELVKSPTNEAAPKLLSNLPEVKKSENELHWEELVKKMQRPLCLCDLDFTDLNSDDEIDVLGPVSISNGAPPPPPPMAPSPGGGPMLNRVPPPPPPAVCRFPPPLPSPPPPLFGVNLKSAAMSTLRSAAVDPPKVPSAPVYQQPSPQLNRKSKKTVKLFWKEVRDDPIILSRLDDHKMIWDELSPVPIDTQKLEHLFESRAKDLITKKQQEMNKNKEIIVLDHKRSNAINIGMTKLPPPRSIKTAILKMDATIMNREGIEKLLTMLPTEEERSRIQEAQAANPDLPLGSAEQFLLTLASISELPARLKLWAFKLDFENSEKEVADPLMDLKQGMETLRVNNTFRGILSTLLSIGIFLNGNEVKGFQMEYLAKVPEVKDTVHKHSLLHHLCHMVMEKFPGSTDLYSEIGAVTRASKVDFDELAMNISKLESECKASWDHLKLIAKHDGSTMMKVKMSDFLTDCAERIIVLSIVHRRIINRFHKFILWLGIPLHRVQDTKPNEFCRIVSEFSLEYRTTRERVLQQLEKKANHRERNKTRGKMITEVGKFRTKEDRADAELRQLLGSDISDVESIHGTLPWRRQRKDGRMSLGPLLKDERANGNLTDGDDELLESLVKTATKTPATRTTPRERKRTRHADLKRSRTRENNTTPDGYRP